MQPQPEIIPPISYSDRQPGAMAPPPPEIVQVGFSSSENWNAFKPAYIPLIGIAALFFYAFSKLGIVILAGIIFWYYQLPHGQRRVHA